MTENELHEQADVILHIFRGRRYNGNELMVVISYILVRLLTSIAEQNSVTEALNWLTDLVKNVRFVMQTCAKNN